MSIYYSNHRSIYESAFGKIPKGYEIHHIDGNILNNDISNLQLVTLQEHYDIHWRQKDYGACHFISVRMKNPDLISISASLSNKARLENGTHNFLKQNFKPETRLKQIKAHKENVANGTHNFLGGNIQRKSNRKRVSEGTHHFLGGELQRKMLLDGRHASCHIKTCSHCGKTADIGNIKRWHEDNCKLKGITI